MTEEIHARFRSCLRGAAIGDALGAPIEFLSWNEIQQEHGGPVTDLCIPSAWGPGAFTDDTQMLLFTAEGLIEARRTGAPNPRVVVWDAYRRWYITQTSVYHEGMYTGLLGEAEMYQRRQPGRTCMAALQDDRYPAIANNDSAGCGAAMRVAPCGLVLPVREAYRFGKETGTLTHGNQRGYVPAGYVAEVIARLSIGLEPRHAVEEALRVACDDQLEPAMLLVQKAAQRGHTPYRSPDEMCDDLGEGWTGDSAAAIATHAFLTDPDFAGVIEVAANHRGDSDSTACIAGSFAGVYHAEVPEGLWRQVRGKEIVDAVADALYEVYHAR